MNCQQVEGVILDYVRGLLSGAKALEIEKHLDGCASCQHDLEEYKQMITLVSAVDVSEVKPSEAFLQGLVKMAVDNAPTPVKAKSPEWLSQLGEWFGSLVDQFRVPAMVAASIAVILVGVTVFKVISPGDKMIAFRTVDRLNWPTDTRGQLGYGLQKTDNKASQAEYTWFFVQTAVSDLSKLPGSTDRHEMTKFLNTVTNQLKKTPPSDQTQTQLGAVQQAVSALSEKDTKKRTVSLCMEKGLLDRLKSSTEKELVIRLGLQVSDQEIKVDIGAARQ
ncbi:MAG: zf-HC2 domain-containing protein [Deltaproteobacteria bacterium]|nr:zf-HC2 domain-containing protein [Deltaproteobacteria bacterium]